MKERRYFIVYKRFTGHWIRLFIFGTPIPSPQTWPSLLETINFWTTPIFYMYFGVCFSCSSTTWLSKTWGNNFFDDWFFCCFLKYCKYSLLKSSQKLLKITFFFPDVTMWGYVSNGDDTLLYMDKNFPNNKWLGVKHDSESLA